MDLVKGVVYVNGQQMVDLKTEKPFTFIRKINSLDDDMEVWLSRFGLGNFLTSSLKISKRGLAKCPQAKEV